MEQDRTVVGATSPMESEVSVDPSYPASVQVDEIRIDAHDLKTDDALRTNRLGSNILKSAQNAYRYITMVASVEDGVTPEIDFTAQADG